MIILKFNLILKYISP